MTSTAFITRTAEVQQFGVGNILTALLDAKVTGPTPMIIRYASRQDLLTRLGESVQLTVDENVKEGDMVVVRRDEF